MIKEFLKKTSTECPKKATDVLSHFNQVQRDFLLLHELVKTA
jgi:hypothetical protein